jgi:hypothetical protein
VRAVDPVRALRRFFDRRRRARPLEFAAVATFGVGVTALHFGSTALTLYARVWWWDLLTHSLSGLGVAAVVYHLRPLPLLPLDRPLALFVAIPAVVLATGAWFEVYERLFTDFWVNWSQAYYMRDTLVDLVMDWLGAVAFGVIVTLWNTRLRRDPPPLADNGR